MIARGNLPVYGIIPDKDRQQVIKLRDDYYEFRKDLIRMKGSQIGAASTSDLHYDKQRRKTEES